MEVRKAIADSYLAQGLTDESVSRLHGIAELRRFRDGQFIMEQFDENRDLMLLKEGAAEILAVTGEPIGEIHPGSVFGEIALIDGKPRAATVVSRGESEVVVFPEMPLRELLRSDPVMMNVALMNLCRTLCARLRSSNQYMAVLLSLQQE